MYLSELYIFSEKINSKIINKNSNDENDEKIQNNNFSH